MFADCSALQTVIFPNTRISFGRGLFTGCSALEVVVASDYQPLSGRRRTRLGIGEQVQIIQHSELHLVLSFVELNDPETPEERRAELRPEIRRALEKIRKRNRRYATATLLENLTRVTEVAIAEAKQTQLEAEAEAEKDTSGATAESPIAENNPPDGKNT